jgi:hypothetical protein
LNLLGVIGEYPGRNDVEVEGRPLYIVDEPLSMAAAGGRPDGRKEERAWAV